MDLRRAGAIVLSIVAIALRLCAIAMCAITVVLCFSGLSARLNMVGFVVVLSRHARRHRWLRSHHHAVWRGVPS